jgi:hypothetical protein
MVPKQKERQTDTQYSCNICWRLPEKEMSHFTQIEKEMISFDLSAEKTKQLKNDCESLIYSYKDKINGSLSDLIDNDKKPKLEQELENNLEWLYDDGSNVNITE